LIEEAVMRLILAAALALPFQASTLDDFYKFKTGTTWSYNRLEEGAERRISGKVIGEEGGSVKLDWKDYEKDGTLKESSILTWSVVDKVLTVEARKEGEAGISFAVLKEGSKKGDKWPSAGGECVHMGKADVTVPAGTYKDAIWTQFKTGEEGNELRVDFYLVPKVGLVKAEISAKDGAPNRFELKEFKEEKK
jgi:hypothetical protein